MGATKELEGENMSGVVVAEEKFNDEESVGMNIAIE